MHSNNSRLDSITRVTTPWRGGGEPADRDMHLIRELLLEIESGGTANRDLSEHTDATIHDHLRLMIEARLLHGSASPGSDVAFTTITWEGHDLLAAIRQDRIWNRIRARLTETGGGLALDAIKSLAISLLP